MAMHWGQKISANLGAGRMKIQIMAPAVICFSQSKFWIPYSDTHLITEGYLPKSTQGTGYGGVKFTFTH